MFNKNKKSFAVKKIPRAKPVTAGYLERAALHYLGRFSSSKANLIDILKRKSCRRLSPETKGYGVELSSEILEAVYAVADKLEGLGYINDPQYARSKARSMLSSGKPIRMITQALRHKGVEQDVIDDALRQECEERDQEDEQDLDRIAIAKYAKKRRFGAYATPGREKDLDKQIQSMMRAGFGYQLIKDIMSCGSIDEIESDFL